MSTTYYPAMDRGFIILRPLGSNAVILVDYPAISVDVVYHNGFIRLAANTDVGAMTVFTFSPNAPRQVLRTN